MKGYTTEEFVEYVKTLQFDDLEDMGEFIKSYYDYYETVPADNKQEKDDAWAKVMILLGRYGMSFVVFGLAVIEFRKKLNEEIKAEEDRNEIG